MSSSSSSSTGRRAFASKIIKDSNVDIRHRFAKILASASSSSTTNPNDDAFPPFDKNQIMSQQTINRDDSPGIIASFYSDTSINDLIDSIDYEDYVQKNSDKIPDEDLRSVLLLPSDDIVVDKYQPIQRTLGQLGPEFNNLNTSDDPYIQNIGAFNSKSLIVIKKHERDLNSMNYKSKRKKIQEISGRQEYEIDLAYDSKNPESISIIESPTPNNVYSYHTFKSASRPQSLISSSSTIKPPLASDEEDLIDEDENCRTPVAQELNNDCDSISSHSLLKPECQNLNQDRNSWTYIDAERFDVNSNQIDTNEDVKSNLFQMKSTQTDIYIKKFLDKNYHTFFNDAHIHYDITNEDKCIIPIFCLYPPQNEEELIEFRPKISPPSDVPRFNFLVKGFSLETDLSIEPLFASIAIYDVRYRKKVTENFYFDLNSESMKHLLQPYIPYQDLSTLSKSAIFSLSHLSPSMYFVIKLEKVFQWDMSECIEAYSRPPEDQNKLEKLKISAKNNCDRLGKYRMFFAWAMFPLSDLLCNESTINPAENSSTKDQNGDTINGRNNNSNSLDSLKRIANECTSNFTRKGSLERHLTFSSNSSNSLSNSEKKNSITSEDLIDAFPRFKPVTITARIFYRPDGEKFSDDDLYKFLSDFKRISSLTGSTKRIRNLPCTLKLEVKPINDVNLINCRVNPELVRLHPYTNDQISPIKEILEFRDVLIPHLEHRNLLYVYPKSVNFTSRQKSARNITIKVELFSSEEKLDAMPVIFGKSSCPEYSSKAYTTINYHNKNPNFYDEFKIRLPSQIGRQTHIFFTFIHVHAKPKNDVDEIIGYTWLPLCKDDCLQTGTFSLPIVSEKPTAGYSFLNPNDSDSLSNLKWIDNHKPLFVVHIESYSSIFAQDQYVDRFFRITSSLESQPQMASSLHSSNIYEEFCRAISDLTNSNIDSLVKFVHIIFNRLIMLWIKPPTIFQQNKSSGTDIKRFKTIIFETLVTLVSEINSNLYSDHNSMRCGILGTFIHYQSIIPQPEHNIYEDQNHSIDSNLIEERINNKTLHEEIVEKCLQSTVAIREKLFEHSFFFFDLIFKSLCVNNYLNYDLKTVPNRLPIEKSFKKSIEKLIDIVGEFIVKKIQSDTAPIPTSPTTYNSSTFNDSSCNLNSSLAYFIRDLLSILERNYVFILIKKYITKISNTTTSSLIKKTNGSLPRSNKNHSKSIDDLFELKVDFLRIICGHEHFIALNLPFGTPLFGALEQSSHQSPNPKFSPSFSLAQEMLDSNIFSNLMFDRIRPYSELTDEYRRQHWLLGLVFCAAIESFTKTRSSSQIRAANLIRSVLTTLDWEQRFKDPKIKHRSACLFLPLIGIMIDVIEQLHDSCAKENPFYSSAEFRKHRKLNGKMNREENPFGTSFIENSIAMAIGTTEDSEKPNSPSKPTSPLNLRQFLSYQPINQEATRILLACFLWTIGNVDHRLLIQYLNEFSNERLLAFLELLRTAMRVFEYQGEKNIRHTCNRRQSFQKLEDTIRYGSARRDLMRRRDSQSFGPTDNNSESQYRWKRETFIVRNSSIYDTLKTNNDDEVVFEGHLCTMMNLIILDSITSIANIFRQRIKCNSSFGGNSISQSNFSLKNKYANDEFVVSSALQALLQLFSLKQSTWVLEAAFDTERAFLYHFPELLFIEGLQDVEFCSELCFILLKHCASQIPLIRAQASASVYLLLRQYHESNVNYSRIKIQITMSLSQLVGTSLTFNEINIRNTLNSILRYALNDSTVRETLFPNQVQELVFNLITILSDTMQMKEHEKDPEMLLDLMYRVAKGYQNSPELRITWLENMAKKHAELAHHVEAAQCYVHASALISECLHKMSRRVYLPVSCAAFQKVCPNVYEESLNSNSEINIEKTNFLLEDNNNSKKVGVSSHKLLSESGLITSLEQAADFFHACGMFEAVNETYKLLLPIHEAYYRYKKLAQIHNRLHDVFIKIESLEGKRGFATYFRVGFYGSLFNDLNQKEFVYKEPFLTKLPEIASRLETFYGNRFGQKNVEVIKDSNTVDVSKLDSHKAYIQITYVEPYFDPWELESRLTCYERNYNLRRFIYSTPFTTDGRAHGKLYEQCKRKTILTLEQAFPYVKTRIQVKIRQQHSLSPIEVAIEDLQKKTKELANATNQEPVDAKILQMVLQGCVGTTVNQGPAEIAKVFLSNEPNIPTGCQRPDYRSKDNLKEAFKEFSARCGDALSKNRKLVNGNVQQMEYHKELERNFYKFTEKLAPLLSPSNAGQTTSELRRNYFEGIHESRSPKRDSNSSSPVINGVDQGRNNHNHNHNNHHHRRNF